MLVQKIMLQELCESKPRIHLLLLTVDNSVRYQKLGDQLASHLYLCSYIVSFKTVTICTHIWLFTTMVLVNTDPTPKIANRIFCI